MAGRLPAKQFSVSSILTGLSFQAYLDAVYAGGALVSMR